MKALPRLLCLLLAPAALLSAAEPAAVTLQPAPSHPTVLSIIQGKDKLSVVKVVGTNPVVIVDGKEKRIVTQPAYQPGRTTGFGPGFVEVSAMTLDGTEMRSGLALRDPAILTSRKYLATIFGGGNGNGGWTIGESADDLRGLQVAAFSTSHFEAKLKSKQRLEGAFALVVVYPASLDALQPPPKYNGPNFMVHELPVLPAGEEVLVKISESLPRADAPQKCFVQIFDATGHEIRTDNANQAWTYYHAEDLIQAAIVTEKYREKFAGANHDVVAYLKAPPVFPDDFTKPAQPGSATLTISSGGEVTKVEMTGIDDVQLQQSLTNAFSDWVFLPRLKAGEPVACKVKIPLQF